MGRQGKLVPCLSRDIVHGTGCTVGRSLYRGVGSQGMFLVMCWHNCGSMGGRSLWRCHNES